MFGFFKKPITFEEYRNKTHRVVIDGVIFYVRRISIEDHLAGLNVILKLRDKYQIKKPELNQKEDIIKDWEKYKKFYRDIIFAGVVKPQLTMKKDEHEKIHVDEILVNRQMSDQLCNKILEISYPKKKYIKNI